MLLINNYTNNIKSKKGLRESILINSDLQTRSNKIQINLWETVFSNKNQNQDNVFKYINQTKYVCALNTTQIAVGYYFNSTYYRFNGTVYAKLCNNSQYQFSLIKALINITFIFSILTQIDFYCSHPCSISIISNNLLENQVRADTAYKQLLSNYRRKNLKILTGQLIEKVIFN